MIEYRAATSSDRDAILALRRRCFPDLDLEKQSVRFAEWEFEQSPGGAAVVMIAVEGDRCLSHVAFVPQAAVFRGEVVRAALAVDAMTDPSSRRRGLYSAVLKTAVDATREEYDLVFAYQNRRIVLGAMLRNGWEIAGRHPVLVRPLSPRGIISIGTDPMLRVHDPSVSLLGVDHAAIMSECAATERDRSAFFPRSESWIRWRFFERPDTTYRVTGVLASGRLSAWLVCRRIALRGVDSLAIVDVAFEDESAARILLNDALTVASDDSVALAAAFVSPSHPLHALLRQKHFFRTPHRFRQLVQTFAPLPGAVAADWPVSWANTDHV